MYLSYDFQASLCNCASTNQTSNVEHFTQATIPAWNQLYSVVNYTRSIAQKFEKLCFNDLTNRCLEQRPAEYSGFLSIPMPLGMGFLKGFGNLAISFLPKETYGPDRFSPPIPTV